MSDGFTIAVAIIGGLSVVAIVAGVVFAVMQIVRSTELNSVERWVWGIAVLFAPLIGTCAWFALGPHPFGIRITRFR